MPTEFSNRLEERRNTKYTDTRLENVFNYSEHPLQTVSLDMPIGKNKEDTLKDLIEDEMVVSPYDNAKKSIVKERIRNAVEKLRKGEGNVVSLRYGIKDSIDRTLREVGSISGVSRERVRQIQNGALKKLKKNPSLISLVSE